MHRLFFDQLGPSGVWIEDRDGEPAGFLLGLISEADPELAYVHMHAVAPRMRGQGVGEALYRDFCARAHARGCRRVRALAQPQRTASRRFHERMGFAATWQEAYLGEGGDRFVYERALPLNPGEGHQREDDAVTVVESDASPERRAHERHAVALPVRVRVDGRDVAARTVDLSEGGVLVAGRDFPSADQLRIEIELAELGRHEIEAEVVRRDGATDGADSLAVRFAEVASHGGREAIREFLRSRLRESRP
ncbi:MAG TPA: GNAT family N-acetyltransferase [Miltoncostaeaceae bacterium]|nr:GNAT family N-acetyltransferase [Miltoncostaeaceae bacterium]